MYTDIEKKLNAITSDFVDSLKKANAIDDQGIAVNRDVFVDIIDKKISECEKLFPLVEDEIGTTTDRYGKNIIYARIQYLNDIKNQNALTIPTIGYEENLISKNTQRQNNSFFNRVKFKFFKIRRKHLALSKDTER